MDRGKEAAVRTVLFYRDFRLFRGGHLKTWDYFNHVLASPDFAPRIAFSEKTRWNATNPWMNAREYVVDWHRFRHPDAFFIGGASWPMVDAHPDAGPDIPVLNIMQHVRHADAEIKRYAFLGRKAIRICVSAEVARAVTETGLVNGPVVVIPNGTDVEIVPAGAGPDRQVDLLIVAMKQPDLGRILAERLARDGRRIELLAERMQRTAFLARLRAARAALFLPNETEGFYLPALEAMAVGALVICPDVVGNRSFCLPGQNAFRPRYAVEELVRETESALALPPAAACQLLEHGRRTAAAHDLQGERRAFLDLLHNVDQLW